MASLEKIFNATIFTSPLAPKPSLPSQQRLLYGVFLSLHHECAGGGGLPVNEGKRSFLGICMGRLHHKRGRPPADKLTSDQPILKSRHCRTFVSFSASLHSSLEASPRCVAIPAQDHRQQVGALRARNFHLVTTRTIFTRCRCADYPL